MPAFLYTGNVLDDEDTELLNICPKNLIPVAPPGTVPIIINSKAIICATANSTVSAVLCASNAQ